MTRPPQPAAVQRRIYGTVLRLHPAPFRQFARQMLLDFDDALPQRGFTQLLADAIVSLARQWTAVALTGLAGSYGFTLEFAPEEAAPPPDQSGPSIFTAVQDQLGLKLTSAKGPVEVLVIDHIEKPSQN